MSEKNKPKPKWLKDAQANAVATVQALQGVHHSFLTPGTIIEANYHFVSGSMRYQAKGWGRVTHANGGSCSAIFWNPKEEKEEKITIRPNAIIRIVPREEVEAHLNERLIREGGE